MTGKLRKLLIKKCIFAVIAAFAAVLVLSACSESTGSPDAADTAEEAPVDAADTAEEAPADAADPSEEASGDSADPSEESSDESGGITENGSGEEGTEESAAEGGGIATEFRDSYFDESSAEGNEDVLIDLSHCSEGYVSLYCLTDGKIKFQVLKDDLTVTYSVVPGKPQIFPLQSGDGHYDFRAMVNLYDSKYAELYSTGADVVINDPFDPFLRPNQYADYTADSQCVQLASEFAASSGSVPEFINKVFDYICGNITYDAEKAQTVESGYLPDPDSTLNEKQGICFDYACLAASMLRSQGVPTKIIFGYVAPNDIYHAWNMFYTEEGGWQLAEFSVSGPDWNRVDMTFYANSASTEFIGDGSNYMDAYEF